MFIRDLMPKRRRGRPPKEGGGGKPDG